MQRNLEVFVPLSDQPQPPRHPTDTSLCILLSLGCSMKRLSIPLCKALRCDTCYWSQRHLWGPTLESEPLKKDINYEQKSRCPTVHPRVGHMLSVFEMMKTNTCRIITRYKTQLSLVTQPQRKHRFCSIHHPLPSLTPSALSWNMHSHSICLDPESTYRREGQACFLCQSQEKKNSLVWCSG